VGVVSAEQWNRFTATSPPALESGPRAATKWLAVAAATYEWSVTSNLAIRVAAVEQLRQQFARRP